MRERSDPVWERAIPDARLSLRMDTAEWTIGCRSRRYPTSHGSAQKRWGSLGFHCAEISGGKSRARDLVCRFDHWYSEESTVAGWSGRGKTWAANAIAGSCGLLRVVLHCDFLNDHRKPNGGRHRMANQNRYREWLCVTCISRWTPPAVCAVWCVWCC